MPLNNFKPKAALTIGLKQTVDKVLNYVLYLNPQIALGIFLMAAIVLAFTEKEANGFYLVFALFIAGYFFERVTKIKTNQIKSISRGQTDAS